MARPGLLLGQSEPPQHPRQAGRVQPLAPPLGNLLGQRWLCPLGAAMAGEIRAGEHEVLVHGTLFVAQHWPAAALGAVVQPGQAFPVVAHHRVMQRLPLHAREPRRLGPAQPRERMGDGIHPRGRPRVLLPPPQSAQLPCAQVRPDLQCNNHRLLPSRSGKGITKPVRQEEPNESAQALAGMRACLAPSA